MLPAVILLAALAAYFAVAAAESRTASDSLDRRAARAGAALERRVQAYGDVLFNVYGQFRSSNRVTPYEFHENLAVQRILERYPGVQAVGFAEVADAGEMPALVRRVNRETQESGLGYPRFRVWPRSGAQRAPITYLEPVEGNERAFGFDFLSDPSRRAALRRTLRSRLPEATGPVRLVQETGGQRGFLIMLGVRTNRTRAHGAAYAAFRTGDLVRHAVGLGSDEEVELYDRGLAGRALPLSRAALAFDSDERRDAGRPGAAPHGSRQVDLLVMGRAWTLYYAPRESGGAGLAWIALPAGLLLAALAAWLLGSAQRTERRATALAARMTEHLRASREELARSNAELERFAYVASHDLREPLRTVTGFLGLLSRRYRDRLDADGREFVDLAVNGARRMDALIAELLEYSRTGRGETEPQVTDVEVAWGVAVRNLSAAIAESGADVTAGALPAVLVDCGEMVQLLQNLLGNAIKYSGDRPPRIRIGAERRGEAWEIAVSDDGPGIDPRDHERIFVLLQRLHHDDEVEGTGIGLAICKKIVERHGGRIWVESAKGAGARFAFTLPAAAPPARVRVAEREPVPV